MGYRLGLWAARMDNSGLGHQTLEFYNHMEPDKTAVIDISILEKTPERVMKQYPERYAPRPGKQVQFIQGVPTIPDMEEFLQDLDVVFIAESAINLDFFRVARDKGVKTVVQYNYEFFDWLVYKQYVVPDMFVAPSSWHYDDVKRFCEQHPDSPRLIYLHCPVNRDKIKLRRIESALTFVHIAGRPADHDRNGTYTFLQAIQKAEGNLSGLVYTQDKRLANEIKAEFPSVKVKKNTADYADLYKKGSVLVLPRRYGGNCLPMNEALAAGMPVIMSRLEPQKDFLPSKWLVAAEKMPIDFKPRVEIPVYETNVYELMLKMLWFKSLSEKDMYEESRHADQLAETISWTEMKPKYQEAFEAICQL